MLNRRNGDHERVSFKNSARCFFSEFRILKEAEAPAKLIHTNYPRNAHNEGGRRSLKLELLARLEGNRKANLFGLSVLFHLNSGSN